MQQWYNCPQCKQYVQYGQPQCHYCGYQLYWQPIQPQPQPVTQISLNDVISQVRSGDWHCILEGVKSPIILRPPEELRVAIPGFKFIESRSVRDTKALYGGPSIRVAKGLSFRLGGASARSQSHDELKTIDTGIFTLTTQRIVFSGNLKTVTIPLVKVLSLEPMSTRDDEGLGIRKDDTAKMQYFTCPKRILKAIDLTFTAGCQTISDKFSGQWLQWMIEGAIHESQKP